MQTIPSSTKDLIIIRGLPGSGKSTLCALLSENGRYPVFSIDDFFTDADGHYNFRFEDNHKAYSHCRERCQKAMEDGVSRIFLDNVFSLDWEMKPYLEMAARFGYSVHVLTAENYHGGSNVHGVSREQLEKMAAKFRLRLY